MCGICGFYNLADRDRAGEQLEGMTQSLAHRGPDGSGAWLSADATTGLGHIRLAVIDLESGKQPMISVNGRYVIVFNGEIYNFQSLRKELQLLGHAFATNSDTEVLLEGFAAWGKDLLPRLHGMFAFSIYDRLSRKLFLARDPVGIKPLYYYSGPKGFFFASEPKAILKLPAVSRQINYRALADFFVTGYPLMPNTFFNNIFEMKPGSWLEVDPTNLLRGAYWHWQRQEMDWDKTETLKQAEIALITSLEEHLISDVPIGSFLSGGIDSSVLAGLLRKSLGVKLDTFSVKFEDAGYDESKFARQVAHHLDTEHHEIILGSGAADLSVVGHILDHFDQPFADSSAIPTYLMCKEVSKYVKVIIGGDGGDEMFGGYRRFYYADVIHFLRSLPQHLLAYLGRLSSAMDLVSPKVARQIRKLTKAANIRGPLSAMALCYLNYPAALCEIFQPETMSKIINYEPDFNNIDKGLHNPDGGDLIDLTIAVELPGDYLRKIDFMSSAHGIEVRVPFLGKQVLDFASAMPNNFRYSFQKNKILLREFAGRFLPAEIIRKPKGGFDLPLDTWLGLRGRAELQDFLGSKRTRIRELIRPQWIDTMLAAFHNKRNLDQRKWSRYHINQSVYMLWALERWLTRWTPNY